MLLGLRKCVFHIQMRQCLTLRIRNINQMAKKTMYCDPNWKYLYGTHPNLVLSRYMSGSESKESYRLPPLMWQHPNFAKLAIVKMLFTYIFLRLTLDKEFRLKSFVDGAKQAMLVISNALGAQDYEKLESLVHERTIRLLKSRINSLRPDQRKLIALESNKFICVPGSISIRKKGNMKVVEIATLGVYVHGNINLIMEQKESIGHTNYIFQRTYVNNDSWTGGPWTVKSISHFI